jgi:GNAT superfamily N-acetyltransferase
VDELESIELSAVLDLFAAAPPDVVDELELAVLDLGGGAAFSIGARPKALLFNRVLGLEDDTALQKLEEWFGSRRCTFVVSVRPGAELERALAERGYSRGSALMKFRRGVEQSRPLETSLRVEQLSGDRAAEYGAVTAEVFGAEPPQNRWLAALATRARWACFGAFDGDRLVGTGAAHFDGALGWLGAGGTLPDARGRGAQSAILAARIRAAADAGVRMLATETVNRVDGVAGPSFRNVVRAGFEEVYVQQWWVPRSPSREE